MAIDQSVRAKREDILTYSGKIRGAYVRLFGSRATGDARSDSWEIVERDLPVLRGQIETFLYGSQGSE
jgi:predicted nucleotidyltransferase